MADEQELQTPTDEQDTENSSTDGSELDENTESDADVGNEENDAQEANENEDEASAKEEEPDYDLLSDDEFTEYVTSGKLPDDYSKRFSSKQSLAHAEDDADTAPEPAKPASKPSASKPKQSDMVQKPSETDAVTEAPKGGNIDYKAVYDTIFKPFKANGKEITPRSTEDVISLMQMGANYTKKMQLMAPIRKAAQSLINNNISEEDLSFLIDLHKGDKEAIKELLKKNNVDVTDLDLDEVKYTRNRRNIASDEDVEFQDAAQDVAASTTKIQEIFDKVWDRNSRTKVLGNPKLLRALHEEIQLGRFDEVQKIVESEKTFGRYKGVDDVDIYIDVVTKLVNLQQQKMQQEANKASRANIMPKAAPSESARASSKSKAAPTRNKTSSKGNSTLTAKDIFSMSDEEFKKINIADLV